VVAARREERTR